MTRFSPAFGDQRPEQTCSNPSKSPESSEKSIVQETHVFAGILQGPAISSNVLSRSRMAEVRGSSPLGSTPQRRLGKGQISCTGTGWGGLATATTPTVTPT